MWKWIKDLIFRLFGKAPVQTESEYSDKDNHVKQYESIDNINFTAIFSNKLAGMAVCDSTVTVSGNNKRAELLNDLLQEIWDNAKTITTQALGTGSVMLLPYCTNNKICTDIVPKNRYFITERFANEIKGVTVIADVIERDKETYLRLVDYRIENGAYVIRNRAIKNQEPFPLSAVPEWAGITEELRIANVDRLPVAILRCPINKRTSSNVDGVPITYGSEALIGQIYECLNQIQREYDLKQAFVGVDSAMFDVNNRLPNGGLFKTFIGDTGEFWHVFDPAIRDSSYNARLQSLFELLEKSVGTSKGILTAPDPATTATEIRRSTYDTWTIVNAIRRQLEKAIDTLVYAYDVLCNAYGLAPQGDYELSFDWDFSLIENTTETFNQLMQAHSAQAIDEVTIRQFVIPSESLEEAQAAVEQIKQKSPSTNQLIGE